MANILKDAIADANVLRETALANAKIALEETFQPTLQRLVSSKIQEEEGDEEDINIDINYGGDEGEEESYDDMGDEGFGSFEDDEESYEDEGSEDMEEGDEMEMESLIRELEGEDDMMDEEWDEDGMEEGEEDSWSDPIEEEDDELSEMEDELSELFEEEDEELSEGEDEMMDEGDDESLEELYRIFEEEGLGDMLDLGQEHEDGAAFTDEPPSGPQFFESRRLRKENRKLRNERNEALKAVTTLKKALNEVNLLNAKLMYTTKALRSYDLNESQKERILNSFDRANSVREVKLVYTTIVESFNKRPIKGRVNEGYASRSVKQVNPTKERLSENNQIANFSRLQELAGIKKIKF